MLDVIPCPPQFSPSFRRVDSRAAIPSQFGALDPRNKSEDDGIGRSGWPCIIEVRCDGRIAQYTSIPIVIPGLVRGSRGWGRVNAAIPSRFGPLDPWDKPKDDGIGSRGLVAEASPPALTTCPDFPALMVFTTPGFGVSTFRRSPILSRHSRACPGNPDACALTAAKPSQFLALDPWDKPKDDGIGRSGWPCIIEVRCDGCIAQYTSIPIVIHGLVPGIQRLGTCKRSIPIPIRVAGSPERVRGRRVLGECRGFTWCLTVSHEKGPAVSRRAFLKT